MKAARNAIKEAAIAAKDAKDAWEEALEAEVALYKKELEDLEVKVKEDAQNKTKKTK